MWDAAVCVNFADELLDFLRSTIEAESGEQERTGGGGGGGGGVGGNPRVTWTVRIRCPFREVELVSEGEKNGFLAERYIRAVDGFDAR
ncbi:MAG: hypothetical protein BJ554DRAFT_5408 [Olpidium bornovanus]|uniref:Uncharacterized protein n=1 Tax=Olpidium bornovanus TaxID=278681 RepID=A0A8H7ZZW2_9FUNG|nr:MAG: hypothetical protein BJ554DRAFT_5408 [Olpidium bornovanus]